MIAKHRVVGLLLGLALVTSPPLGAQSAGASFAGFDHGIVASGDWLQANSLPLNRNAVHSGSLDLSLRRRSWAADVAWVRIARDLSTVQGVAVSVGPLLHWRRVMIMPALGAFGGEAQASRDSTGYDWTDGSCTLSACTAGPAVGHEPRYSYSSAAAFGGSASLTVEVPVYRAIGVRAVAQQWYFGGAPLAGDRSRTLVGAGVSLRLNR